MRKNSDISVKEIFEDETMDLLIKKVENKEIIFRGNFLFRYIRKYKFEATEVLNNNSNLSRNAFLAIVSEYVHPQFTQEEVLKFISSLLEVYHTHTEKTAETATV